jgi:hypothetical protein
MVEAFSEKYLGLPMWVVSQVMILSIYVIELKARLLVGKS